MSRPLVKLLGAKSNVVSEFWLSVCRGLIPGLSMHWQWGCNHEVGDTAETMWCYGGAYTWKSAAVTVGVSSSDANDAAAGTGARTVRISGLDADYAAQTEDLALDGKTKVETVNKYLRIHEMKVLTAGTSKEPEGDIYAYDTSDTVTDGVPQTAAKVFAKMISGENIAGLGIYTVPANMVAYLVTLQVSMETTENRVVKMELKQCPYGGVFMPEEVVTLKTSGTLIFRKDLRAMIKFEEKTDIQMDVVVDSSTIAAYAKMGLILVDNESDY